MATGVGAFVGLQLVAQGRVLAWLQRWRVPAWVKFFTTAVTVSCVFLALELGLLATMSPFGVKALFDNWSTIFSYMALWYVAWYGTWWGVLWFGWADVSTSLIVAGVHWSLIGQGWPRFEGWGAFWALPVWFFGGWCLMFLPGAIAAYEFVPGSRGTGSWIERIAGWVAPVILPGILVLLIVRAMAAAHQ